MKQEPFKIIDEYWDRTSIPFRKKMNRGEIPLQACSEIDKQLVRLRMDIDSMSSSLDYLEQEMVKEKVELSQGCKDLYKGLKDRTLQIRAEFNMSVYLLLKDQRVDLRVEDTEELEPELKQALSLIHKKFGALRDKLDSKAFGDN